MAELWLAYRLIDKYVFKWVVKELEGATPEQIVAFYVDKFIFHNVGYLEHLQVDYKLPDDILKIHSKIIKLAEQGN